MKKSNLVLLIVVVVLTIAVVVIYFWDRGDTQAVYKDFAVEDTASVDKIFLADRNNSVLLEKINGVWMVNGKYNAREDFINVLLKTFHDIEVSAPVSKSKLDMVMKSLSVKGIKTQIYQNGDLTKTYYVGGVTPNNTGTYMIMEGSELPFVTHIPGFSGYLTVRYLPDVKEWRERIIFNYDYKDIAKVTVDYPQNSSSGFVISSYGNNEFQLTNIDGTPVEFDVDTLAIKTYLGSVKFLGFEAFISEDLQEHKLDSLLNEPMTGRFMIEDQQGNLNSFRTYPRQNINNAFDDDGNLYKWDIDRLYGIVHDDSEVVLLQYYTIDHILWDINRFRLK